MPQTTLSSVAFEMLESTNIYKKSITEIRFTTNRHTTRSLLDCVNEWINANKRLYRVNSNNCYEIAFLAISRGMSDYLEEYPAFFSFKQTVRQNFKDWLNKIINKYGLSNASIPDEFKIEFKDQDTAIVLLKDLHSREGITKDDLHDKHGIKKRSIQKSLRKLDYTLYEGTADSIEKDYVPFKIGGQPISVSIKTKDVPGSNKKHYYTPNSLHPIVLQENLMQVGTLLKSLSLNYYDNDSLLSCQIAIDIWSQLSDYAKDRIENNFAWNDKDLIDFIYILKDECPDDRACVFRTEKDSWLDDEMSINEALIYLLKVPDRTCNIELKDGRAFSNVRISHADNHDALCYEALLSNGERILFKKDDIKTIGPY